MIQRRQILGTFAALAALPVAPRLCSAASIEETLDWPCRIIETLPLNRARRSPVVTSVSLQGGGNLLAIVGDDHNVSIYDLSLDKYVKQLDQHRDWVRAAKFSPTGDRLATAGNDRQLLVWKTGDWLAPLIIKSHPQAIFDLAYSPNGNLLGTVGFESSLRIYESNNGELVQSFQCACPDNHAVAFSNDGQLVAAGGRCGTIRVWNLGTGAKASEFQVHQRRVRSIEFGAGNLILSCGDDRIARITNPGNPEGSRALPRSGGKLYSVHLLGGGLIATGGSDNQIHIWQIKDAQRLGSLQGHTGTVTSIDHHNNMLVSGSYDTHVRIWTMDPQLMAGRLQAPVRRAGQTSGWSRKLK